MDKLKAKKQAKEILDKFAKALEKVKITGSSSKNSEGYKDFYIEREEFEREEGKAEKPDESFKSDFLENAPRKDKDFVIAEKGGWK